MMERLRDWSLIRKVVPREESAAVTGGREGELLLGQLVGASFPFKDARLLAGRRIPSKRQGRRREIDLFVCTPRMIHLIVVKNWSGRLGVHNGVWRQTRRSGEVVDHSDLIETNRLRRDAVVEYLHERSVILDDKYVTEHIVSKIIFTNPRLELEPEIEARPDVFSWRELNGYLGRRPEKSAAGRVFSSVVEFCLDSEAKVGGTLMQTLFGRGNADQCFQVTPQYFERSHVYLRAWPPSPVSSAQRYPSAAAEPVGWTAGLAAREASHFRSDDCDSAEGRPATRPSTLMSSSSCGQWIPSRVR